MNSEIQLHEGNVSGGLQIRSMDDLSRVSKMLAQSRFFTDAIDAAQCGVKVLAGTEMGFGAFASMTGIHIIKGKPSIGAGLMASAVKRHPNYNYRVLEHSEQVCRIAFYEKWDGKLEQVGTSEFTLADAKKAGTQNLDKYARNMLFARAMSNGVKWYCPDVFDAPVYTPEELGAAVDGEGNYIEAQVTAVHERITGDCVPGSVYASQVSPAHDFSDDAVAHAAYGKDNGLTSANLQKICRDNNLPNKPSAFTTKAQVETFAAEIENAIAALGGPIEDVEAQVA